MGIPARMFTIINGVPSGFPSFISLKLMKEEKTMSRKVTFDVRVTFQQKSKETTQNLEAFYKVNNSILKRLCENELLGVSPSNPLDKNVV